MKRFILLLFTGLTSIPMLAQLNGDGYYRIQNTSSYGRYLTISNDRVDKTNKNEITGGKEGNVYGLKTVKDPVSDPSSIIYISKDADGRSSSACNIQAQGINPLKFLKDNGAELRIYHPSSEANNHYYIWGNKGDIALYLVDNNGSDGYIKVARKDAYPKNQTWKLYPVDNISEYYGIAPDENIKVGDKYYTTVYASFPFQLGEGMKAFYVVDSKLDSGIPYAELKEINNGKVPAATPVIIECSSLNPADNKVALLSSSEAPSAISGNKLAGVYFCYVKMKGNTGAENTASNYSEIKNVTTYDPNKMRVLGIVNGKLGLVDATDDALTVTDKGRYIPANKAYFPISESVAKATANGILLLDKQGIDDLSKIITDGDYLYEKTDESGDNVSVTGNNNVSGEAEIPEKVTGNDGKEYNVTGIAKGAFQNNEMLTAITIPSNINYIGESAFAGCKNLKKIINKVVEPIDLNKAKTRADGSSVFDGVDYENCILYVPEESIEKYKAAEVWSNFKNILAITSGINDIRLDEKTGDVYNLKGQKVLKQASSIEQLPQGVYIVNGKKIIKK